MRILAVILTGLIAHHRAGRVMAAGEGVAAVLATDWPSIVIVAIIMGRLLPGEGHSSRERSKT